MSPRIPFSGNPLDRAERQRRDPKWVAAQLEAEDSRFLPIWRLEALLKDPEPGLGWVRGEVRELATSEDEPVLLGLRDGVAHFALDLSGVEKPLEALGVEGEAHFEDVRGAAMRLALEDGAMASLARSRIDWHTRHRFCATCGSSTRVQAGGGNRLCIECSAEHFPRTDPVVIAVVERGDRCLLGRQRGFPKRMYSALAGFVEPGETLEEALRREISEEAGVPVGTVRYVASQPWPFPSSLMIGFIAEALADELDVDSFELEEAAWFERDEVRRALAGDASAALEVPPAMAIAHHLLRAWIHE